MEGSFLGTVAALLYFLGFQAAGIYNANRIFYRLKPYERLLLGSVIGSLMLFWLPALFSFAMGFNLWSHLCALFVCALTVPLCFKLFRGCSPLDLKLSRAEMKPLLLILPMLAFFLLLLLSETIRPVDGTMHTGQCGYGDMNMHLGFITSTAVQGTFPPEYSILPGTQLSYPFLCDTVSSSMYIFGCSLRFAYILPMLFAFLQVECGVYLFARAWLKDRSKAMLAWTLFFFCGGFGFIYFIDGLRENPDNFIRIFTEFYNTPTNYLDKNVRWVNIVCDMLLPQRATLFGWAVLFPTLLVLYRATFTGERRLYIAAAVMAGCLPMIHTHSFLALAMICACWLLWTLVRGADRKQLRAVKKFAAIGAAVAAVLIILYAVKTLLDGGLSQLIGECGSFNDFLNTIKNGGLKNSVAGLEKILVPTLITGLLIPVACGIYLLAINIRAKKGRELLITWGAFLGIVLLLSLPQLFKWTFSQVSTGTMLRPHFNWDNQNDLYIWYYIRNVGMVALLAVPALISTRKTLFKVAAPALLILFVCELIVFQPNVYDNNKLLYVGYALAACVVASYLTDIYRLLRAKISVSGTKVLAVITVFLCVFSAVLTMGREAVSDYELYGKDQINACKYIEEYTPADSVFMTTDRHNNAVSSLTGRNIVCGAGTFLYCHGLDYQTTKNELDLMWSGSGNTALMQKHNVDFIFYSAYERGTYRAFDENAAAQLYPLVYSNDDVKIYAVSARAKECVTVID